MADEREKASQSCACVARDAYWCISLRYGKSYEETIGADAEECQCCCHDDDEDD